MSKLLIEQMTEQVQEVEKTAEEIQMEKVAHVMNVVEQANVLTGVAGEMAKIAEAIESEPLMALAADTYQMGERFGACLSKTASEDGSALEEALEIAEDLNKIASAYASVADEINDEEFNKLAEAVIAISNEMTDEANEVFEKMAMHDPDAPSAEPIKRPDYQEFAKETKKGMPLDPSERTADQTKANKHVTQAKHLFNSYFGGHAWKGTHAREIMKGKSLAEGVKALLGSKEGLKALARPGVAYGTAALALAGAGYGAKKLTEKK